MVRFKFNKKLSACTLICILMLLLLGCIPRLSVKGELVQVLRESEKIEGCHYLGSVSGTYKAGLSSSQKMDSALIKLKNNAALLGADTVLIVSMDSMFQQNAVKGKAYDCASIKK